MKFKNIISILILVMILLMLPASVFGYTFGRGSMHDLETSDYVLHPEKNKIVQIEDIGYEYTNQVLSDYEEMLFPDETPICMHDFSGHGSLYGYPHTGLQGIGPHLDISHPGLDDIGPHLVAEHPYGGWGEPAASATGYGMFEPDIYGHFYGSPWI